MNKEDIYIQVSEELEIPVEVIREAYESYWKFIKDKIKSLPLKEDLTEKEFNNYRTNFNIPSLGKLSCTFERMKSVKKRFEYLNKIKQSNGNYKEN